MRDVRAATRQILYTTKYVRESVNGSPVGGRTRRGPGNGIVYGRRVRGGADEGYKSSSRSEEDWITRPTVGATPRPKEKPREKTGDRKNKYGDGAYACDYYWETGRFVWDEARSLRTNHVWTVKKCRWVYVGFSHEYRKNVVPVSRQRTECRTRDNFKTGSLHVCEPKSDARRGFLWRRPKAGVGVLFGVGGQKVKIHFFSWFYLNFKQRFPIMSNVLVIYLSSSLFSILIDLGIY